MTFRAAFCNLFALTLGLFPLTLRAETSEFTKQLAAAQAKKDQAEVEKISKAYISELGPKAGTPEEASEYLVPDEDVKVLTAEQVQGGFETVLNFIQSGAWWKTVSSGAESKAPLRAVASVVEGCLAAKAAGCDQADTLLAEAKAAADFLLKAQEEGGHDCFPFPGWRGKKGKLGMMAEKFLSKAEAAGKVDTVMKNGWIIDDLGGGDLYFDNGLCGSAVLAMYEETKDEKYLKSAKAAAAWAMKQPCVPNWNYNSFSVHFLAQMHRVTKDAVFLEAAKEKCRLGMLPGQLTSGPNAGRWADPHNAKLVYHFIMMRGLTSLLLELGPDDADREAIYKALATSLKTRNAEIIEKGGTSPDSTLEVYVRILSAREKLAALIDETKTSEAARVIFRASVEEVSKDHPTISPGSWGRYLRYTAGK